MMPVSNVINPTLTWFIDPVSIRRLMHAGLHGFIASFNTLSPGM
jgi:hypothetical protein